MHKFSYRWQLADTIFTKDKGTVFSCFACGGGSTMGYKLAGFDVIGCNEIDPKMMRVYVENHNPKYSYLEPIQTFKDRHDLPKELYNLDILDGSPPCSPFSDANNKGAKHWGKERVFREGQAKQVLDTLFFDFIDLAKKLQPKIVIAENVPGLLFKRCEYYVKRIYNEFELAGFNLKHFVVNASWMGVPQRRKRVFFIAINKKYDYLDFNNLDMVFNEPEISFKDATYQYWNTPSDSYCIEKYAIGKEWYNTPIGRPSGERYLQLVKPSLEKPCNTIVATSAVKSAASVVHPIYCRKLNKEEVISCSSFPMDYNFLENAPAYICGMSVPPLMVANIAARVYSAFLSSAEVAKPKEQTPKSERQLGLF